MAPYYALPDTELASLLKKGDQAAYTEIFTRYSRLLIMHAYRMLGDQDEANDVVQDVLLRIWQNRDRVAISSSLSAYLYTATRNRVFDRFSQQKNLSRYADSILDFMETGQAVTDEMIRAKELAAIIEKEIAALPPRMREIFLLYKQEGLSYQEIAERLHISGGTAKQQVYNALKILRAKIDTLIIIPPFL